MAKAAKNTSRKTRDKSVLRLRVGRNQSYHWAIWSFFSENQNFVTVTEFCYRKKSLKI